MLSRERFTRFAMETFSEWVIDTDPSIAETWDCLLDALAAWISDQDEGYILRGQQLVGQDYCLFIRVALAVMEEWHEDPGIFAFRQGDGLPDGVFTVIRDKYTLTDPTDPDWFRWLVSAKPPIRPTPSS